MMDEEMKKTHSGDAEMDCTSLHDGLVYLDSRKHVQGERVNT